MSVYVMSTTKLKRFCTILNCGFDEAQERANTCHQEEEWYVCEHLADAAGDIHVADTCGSIAVSQDALFQMVAWELQNSGKVKQASLVTMLHWMELYNTAHNDTNEEGSTLHDLHRGLYPLASVESYNACNDYFVRYSPLDLCIQVSGACSSDYGSWCLVDSILLE